MVDKITNLKGRLAKIRLASKKLQPLDYGNPRPDATKPANPVKIKDAPTRKRSNKYMQKRQEQHFNDKRKSKIENPAISKSVYGKENKKKKHKKEDIEIASGLARTESEGGFGEKTPSWEQGGN